jgi:NTP pyrophosphatase (non-canonical NTP hydrolase)
MTLQPSTTRETVHVALQRTAKIIMEKCRQNNAGGTIQSQTLAVAEEAGEFVGAMRRWQGMARRSGTEEEAQAELADVIISVYAMADVMGWDIEQLIAPKIEKIFSRGWKE